MNQRTLNFPNSRLRPLLYLIYHSRLIARLNREPTHGTLTRIERPEGAGRHGLSPGRYPSSFRGALVCCVGGMSSLFSG